MASGLCANIVTFTLASFLRATDTAKQPSAAHVVNIQARKSSLVC